MEMFQQPTLKLINGGKIPMIGFGTYKATENCDGRAVICEAIRAGYRLLDTATLYGNEATVGEAVRASGVAREDLFLTTKVANRDRGYDPTLRACERSLKLLGTEWLDLYLIHWPASAGTVADWEKVNRETWRAMERLLELGMVRAIGVSNFEPVHLDALMVTANQLPMVNQIEFHPGWMQSATLQWCQSRGIIVEAWSPLGRTRLMDNTLLRSIADRYDKSVAQICLRWAIQHDVVPIPKSVNSERMRENLSVFDFCLSESDMALIDAMPPTGQSGLSPDTITF